MEMMLLNAGAIDWEALEAGLEAMEDLEDQESGETTTIPRPKILSEPLVSVAMETISTRFSSLTSLTEYSESQEKEPGWVNLSHTSDSGLTEKRIRVICFPPGRLCFYHEHVQ